MEDILDLLNTELDLNQNNLEEMLGRRLNRPLGMSEHQIRRLSSEIVS